MEPVWLNVADPIPYTARIVAAKRAIEQWHPTPLFNDPYAAALAGDEVNILIARWQAVAKAQAVSLEQVIVRRTRYIAIRTKFMDDFLRSAAVQVQDKQVVILGAGLDTRAYRLVWSPGTTVYEVDCPNVLHYKSHVLQEIAPTCTYRPVPGDLTAPDAKWVTDLLNAGYQPVFPTIWLMEGVLMYLQETAVHRLLKTITELSITGSVLGMDGVKVGSILAGERARRADRGRVIQHWQFGNDQPQQLLAGYGWSAGVSEPQDIDTGYGRYTRSMPMGTATTALGDGRGVWLVNAIKQ